MGAARLRMWGWLAGGVAALLASMPSPAADLGQAQLEIAGSGVTIAPESQTVPFDTPTVIETFLEGYDASAGPLPAGLRVRGDLSGPDIDGVLALETLPNEPFRIPRLQRGGEYRLEDIRLVEGDQILTYASPRSAAILVTQVLVTRVTSRPLTLEEIRSYGIAIDEDSFRAFDFTFGFGVDGSTYDFHVPVVFGPDGAVEMLDGSGGGARTELHPRFRPPQVAPFQLEMPPRASDGSSGGCVEVFEPCEIAARVPIPGVILFPADVRLLHQFFSVVLMVQNGAPAGDPLVLRDLTARLSLPPGLRLAETEPPTYLGTPLPIRVPGPDGRLGTADDLSFLVAQGSGEAQALVEGLREGTHLVKFDIAGVLEGLPTGPQPVNGVARGAVIVRDPTLGITISHPEVVRADEEYPLLLTITNTGNTPANLVGVAFDLAGLSGVEVIGATSKTIDTLLPGDAGLLEFRLRSHRTGRVVATGARVGGGISPRFELTAAVGEGNAPLSPTTILLPRAVDHLPENLVRRALNLIGLGFSLATAPPAPATERAQVGRAVVDARVTDLMQAGRTVGLGDEVFDSVALLSAEWLGSRDSDWEWDRLRRTTAKGAAMAAAFGEIFAAEVQASSPEAAFERWARATSHLPAHLGVLASGGGVSLEVASRTSGKRLTTEIRDLPFAELYDLPAARLAVVSVPEAGGYRLRVSKPGGGVFDLAVLLPSSNGELVLAEWSSVSLGAAGVAVAEVEPSANPLRLLVDADGDGTVDDDLPATVRTLSPPSFEVLAAVPNYAVDPSGHVVEVLFSADVDRSSLLPKNPAHFTIPGKLSNGGVRQLEAAPSAGAIPRSTRIVTVIFDNPLSPYTEHALTVSSVRSVTGALLGTRTLAVSSSGGAMPGGLVEGTVLGADGQPLANAEVRLVEWDHCPTCLQETCRPHTTAALRTSASGQFRFDYVRQNPLCGNTFELKARDTATGHRVSARNAIRLVGETVRMDLVLRGRGTVRGLLRYDDGGLVREPSVLAYNPSAGEGRRATVAADGSFEVSELPVGAVTLTARDGQGGFVFATVEVPAAGALVEHDLTILRRPSGPAPGEVRGIVLATDGTTPIADAWVALYVAERLVAVLRSDAGGTFDFGSVPAGIAEIEAFDGASGRLGTHVTFEIEPDRVSEVTLLLRDERGTVEGHVFRRGPGGIVPLAGATVWIAGTPFNTTSDADGFYRLVGVFEGTRSVRAVDPERSREVGGPVSVAGGATATADLYFDEVVAGGIAGEVLGFDGTPVAGATVHLQAQEYYWYRTETTDINGRFVLPNLGPGRYSVHAFAGAVGGKATAEIRFVGDTPFVSIRFKSGRVRGRVLADTGNGTPAGVQAIVNYRSSTVRFELVGLDNVEHSLQTAADGTFELPESLVGPYVLTVTNPFHGTTTVRGELVNHGQINEHELVLGAAGEIRGFVLQPDGVTPAAGATVRLRHPATGLYDVTADAGGRFVFGLVAPQAQRFAVEAEWSSGGVFRQGRIWVQLPRPNQELDVEIVLPKQGSVLGWVEDANAVRVGGAVVTLQEHEYPHRRLTANSDQDGLFAFHNVFAGTISISAQAPQLGGLGGKETVVLDDEGEEEFAVVRLQAVGEIEGRVLSPVDGAVVSGAEVRLYRGATLVDRTTTDAEGGYRFQQLKLATYEARAFDPASGRNGRRTGLEIVANNQLLEGDLTLEARGEVNGHLREPQSTVPVPAATVKLTSFGLTPFLTYSSTGADGGFEFLGVPEGSLRLSAAEPAGRRRASAEGQIISEGQQLVLDLYLDEIGTVVGTVLNPVGAPAGPFPNANPRLVQDGDVVGASLGSTYAFDRILVGRRFTVLADEVGGLHKGEAKGTLSAHGEELQLDVRMVPLGAVEVSVVTAGGAPVPGASVQLASSGFYGNKTFTGGTGSDHVVRFDNVGAGELSVYVTDPATGLRGSARGTLVNEGQVVALQVALQSSGEVRGLVLLADGVTPAVDALVVLDRTSTDLRAFTDDTGQFAFPAVPMGSFTVIVVERFGPGTRTVRGGQMSTSGQVIELGTLVLDDRDPAVEAITPSNGTTDLPTSTTIRLDFSEPLNPARVFTADLKLRKVAGAEVTTTRTWSNGNRTVTLHPSSPLASFTRYEVIVAGIEDVAGRAPRPNLRSSFSTADVIPPVVIDTLPRAGSVSAGAATQPRITFSEPVSLLSLSGTALQLVDLTAGGAGVTTTFTLLPGEREVVLTPAEALPAEHHFRLTVQSVQDLSGNSLAVPFVVEWETADVTPPRLVRLAPAAGASFLAGAPVVIAVEAFDNRGVADTTFLLGGRTVTDATLPYGATIVAPNVTAEQDVPIVAQARDAAGNVGEITWLVRVSPNDDPGVPDVRLAACLHAGDFVWPGVPQPIGFTITDDQGVASYEVRVDGQVVDSVTANGASTVSSSYTWMPPAAAPGTSFVIEVRGADFAGNSGAALVSLVVPTVPVLAGSMNLFSTLHDSQSLVLTGGTFTVQDALTLENLTLLAGARLVGTSGTTLDLTVNGRLRLQCGSSVDASGLGATGTYAIGSSYYGETPQRPGAYAFMGGSHGGAGAQNRTLPNTVEWPSAIYDSVTAPRLVGGAGGVVSGSNGSGGGAVFLRAGELALDGEIVARGTSGGASDRKTGGAGGSIRIEAERLLGAGRIDASGGDGLGCSNYAAPTENGPVGAGGGGRVGLRVNRVESFDAATQTAAHGGQYPTACEGKPAGYAGAGTVYLFADGMTHGELYVDQGKSASGVVKAGEPTQLPALSSASVVTFSVDGADAWVTASGTTPQQVWIGAWMVLLDVSGAELGAFRVADRDAAGRLRLSGAGTVLGAASFRGEYRFDRIALANGAGLWSTAPIVTDELTLAGSSAGPNRVGAITATNVTVKSGAWLRPLVNREITLAASNELVIESGAVLDATGGGYAGTTSVASTSFGVSPVGVQGSGYGSGGSHGGSGLSSTYGSSVAGEIYDSVYGPSEAGAAGGSVRFGGDGGAGGAFVRLSAPSVRLDGEIRAGGTKRGWTDGTEIHRTGGAGGTVVVTAQSLAGSGAIDVSGGDGEGCSRSLNSQGVWTWYPAGPGGGGRVALLVSDLSSFDAIQRVDLLGGAYPACQTIPAQTAGSGTLYLHHAGSTFGELFVAGSSSLVTELPKLGAGVVGSVAAGASGSLWITPADAATKFDLGVVGMWARVAGVDYRVLEQSGDRRSIRLEGAAGAVSVGQSYEGVYKFDRLTVRGTAKVGVRDADVVAEVVTDAGATFWHRDRVAPVVGTITPAAGAVVGANTTLLVTAEVTDDVAVGVVHFSFAGQTISDSVAPYEASFTVPGPLVPTAYTLGVEAVDTSGNRASATRALTVSPDGDFVPPAVTLTGCPAAEDRFVPGIAVSVPFTATDAEGVVSYTLLVRGVVVQTVAITSAGSVTAALSWTPPAGYEAGGAYELRVEARDAAGNVGFAAVQLRAPSGTLLTGTQNLGASLNGQVVTLATGTFTVTAPLALAELNLVTGAKLTAAQTLDVDVTGEMRVQCGASVDLTAKGFLGGHSGHPNGYAPAGVSVATPDYGGSHGGYGNRRDGTATVPGAVYDSVYEPILGGGGGAQSTTSTANNYTVGAGGGVVLIDAGTLVLGGEILANGGVATSNYRASGAGGTVNVRTAVLRGQGRIDASGGLVVNGTATDGAGGGGRVALWVTTLEAFDPAVQVSAYGGKLQLGATGAHSYGSPGTVLVHDGSSTYGRLVVDQPTLSSVEPPVTFLPALGGGSVSSWSPSGPDAWLAAGTPFASHWVGTWVRLRDAAGAELGVFRVAELGADGRLRLAGAAAISAPSSYLGEYRFDRLELRNRAALSASDPLWVATTEVSGFAKLPAKLAGNEVIVKAGAVAGLSVGPTLDLDLAQRLVIETGAVLHADGKGYSGGVKGHPNGYAPAGITASTPDSGGSHGGTGRAFSNGAAGAVFDSVYFPRLGGGGGAQTTTSATDTSTPGAGGGVISVRVPELVLDGTLRARGVAGGLAQYACGAGGTVFVDAGLLRGTGSIDASASTSYTTSSNPDGQGGGGRVALYVDQFQGFDPHAKVVVEGGRLGSSATNISGYAAAGTLLVWQPGMSYGELILGNTYDPAEPFAPTELPALGSGVVTEWTTEGADAWLARGGGFNEQWLGTSVVALDASGAELGTFRALDLDATGRLRLEGAAAVSGAASFRGEYRFDRIVLQNEARFITSDRVWAGETRIVAGNSVQVPPRLTGQDMVLEAGSSVQLASGSVLELDLSGTLEIEPGARIDLVGAGYGGGVAAAPTSHPNGYAPANVGEATPDYGGSHGGVGSHHDGPGTTAGEIYDSVYFPLLPGAGGAASTTTSGLGGRGGGALIVRADQVVLDGEIWVQGDYAYNTSTGAPYQNWPSGAGGSVNLTARVLSGAGSIDARGITTWAPVTQPDGSSGGGRVALDVDTLSGFNPETQVWVRGGRRYSGSNLKGHAAPGTLYVKQPHLTYGKLYVVQDFPVAGDTLPLPVTELPAVGTGVVGVAEPHVSGDGSLWIEPQDAVAKFSLGVTGMWVRIGGVDYRVLEQASRRRIRLESAAGVVDVGQSYQGLYKFDVVYVRGRAKLRFVDAYEAGLQIEDGSAVVP